MTFSAGDLVICTDVGGFPAIYPHPKPELGGCYRVQYVMPVGGFALLKLEGLPALQWPWRFKSKAEVAAMNNDPARLSEPFPI